MFRWGGLVGKTERSVFDWGGATSLLHYFKVKVNFIVIQVYRDEMAKLEFHSVHTVQQTSDIVKQTRKKKNKTKVRVRFNLS